MFVLRYRCSATLAVLVLLASAGGTVAQGVDPAPARYDGAIAALKKRAVHEIEEKRLPGLSIALVEDQKIVWADGFGFADPHAKVRATPETVYRVGSVSKLFTAIGIMQMVENGRLDLDAPVTQYLPDFHPANPFGGPITLRELMSHQAGLPREPPVGNYFDSSEPSLERVVQSLNQTTLVYAPGTHTKYSNAGDTVAGYILERLAREPYQSYLKTAVLEPMGLSSSAFTAETKFAPRLAKGFMWTYDGRRFPAPTFALGTGPAGNMVSTVLDQARFLEVLFADGRPVLKPGTLRQMFAPQPPGSGFGLSFARNTDSVDGVSMVGHRGGIYGFSSEVLASPDEKLGAVVMINMDNASEVAWHVALTALRLLRAARAGRPLPQWTIPEEIPADKQRALAGRWENGKDAFVLAEHNGRLYLDPLRDGERVVLRMYGTSLISDDINGWGYLLQPVEGGLAPFGDTSSLFRKVADPAPAAIPPDWRQLLGDYGPNYNPVRIMERDGQLTGLIEMSYAPLTHESGDTWAFSPESSYDREKLTFVRDADGCPVRIQVGGVALARQSACGKEGTP
jgi:CubicO group peptidase (beta-lactamase class C family)